MTEFKLNLQLFATPDDLGNYADTPISKSTTSNIAGKYKDSSDNDITGQLANLSAEMKEFYSNMLIKLVGPELIHAQFGEKEALPKGHGSTIEWRRWSKFEKALTPLTEGVTPVAQTLSVTPIRKDVNQYGAWSMVTDMLEMKAIDNVIVEYTTRHSENMKLTLDTICRNELIAGITSEMFAGGVKTISNLDALLTVNDVAKIATELKKKNAPKFDGSYVMIIHPAVAYDIMTSNDWIDVQKYSNAANIFNGEIGKLYGVRFVESTEAKVNKAKKIGTSGKTVLTVSSYDGTSAPKVLNFASNTFEADHELKDKEVVVKIVSGTTVTYETHKVSDSTTSSLTITGSFTGTPTQSVSTVWLSDSACEGEDYFTCIALGKGAYKVVDLDGNMEVIVKGKGQGDDPLNQRSTVGVKVNGYCVGVTIPEYALKFYCKSSIYADGND